MPLGDVNNATVKQRRAGAPHALPVPERCALLALNGPDKPCSKYSLMGGGFFHRNTGGQTHQLQPQGYS
jgi:hypothetical protein